MASLDGANASIDQKHVPKLALLLLLQRHRARKYLSSIPNTNHRHHPKQSDRPHRTLFEIQMLPNSYLLRQLFH